MGRHNEAVLRDLLGYDDDTIAELVNAGGVTEASRPGELAVTGGRRIGVSIRDVAAGGLVVVLAACGSPPQPATVPSRPADSSSTSSTNAPTAAPGKMGEVAGTVTLGSTCPAQTPDRPCPLRPVSVRVVASTAEGTVAASTDSGADGRFSFTLPVGPYTLATAGPSPRCDQPMVTVVAGTSVAVAISCEPGLR